MRQGCPGWGFRQLRKGVSSTDAPARRPGTTGIQTRPAPASAPAPASTRVPAIQPPAGPISGAGPCTGSLAAGTHVGAPPPSLAPPEMLLSTGSREGQPPELLRGAFLLRFCSYLALTIWELSLSPRLMILPPHFPPSHHLLPRGKDSLSVCPFPQMLAFAAVSARSTLTMRVSMVPNMRSEATAPISWP